MVRSKFFLFAPLLAAATLLFCGCEQFAEAWEEAISGSSSSDSEKTRYTIAICGEVQYPRAGEMETEITTFDGKSIWIKRLPVLTSSNIQEVTLTPNTAKPNHFDLVLKLTGRGAMLWSQMVGHYQDTPVVLLIDGVYQCRFIPRPLRDENSVYAVIPGPFDSVTANGVQKYSKKNYNTLSPSPTRPLW